MNWKVLFLSLFITPLLAAEAFLNMSINIKGKETTLSNIILSDDRATEVGGNNFNLIIRSLPEASAIDYSCDIIFEVTILEGEKIITEPTFHLKWNEESVIEFDSKKFVFSVIASQEPLEYGFNH